MSPASRRPAWVLAALAVLALPATAQTTTPPSPEPVAAEGAPPTPAAAPARRNLAETVAIATGAVAASIVAAKELAALFGRKRATPATAAPAPAPIGDTTPAEPLP